MLYDCEVSGRDCSRCNADIFGSIYWIQDMDVKSLSCPASAKKSKFKLLDNDELKFR